MDRTMSQQAIYPSIWLDKADGGDLWTHLRQAAYQWACKQCIATQGHWEIATVHGHESNHCIVTPLESTPAMPWWLSWPTRLRLHPTTRLLLHPTTRPSV
jgi:hypothetical protein